MEDMKTFLKRCGLSAAIPVFERHKIRVDQLDEMCSDDFKELLPALGDRLELRKAIKRRSDGSLYNRPITKSQKKSEVKLAPTKTIMKNDPEKKAFVVQMLKDDRHVAELYQMATNVLIEFSLFSFDSGCRRISPDWTLIDFDDGSLNCLLCQQKILIQTREGSGMLWNVGNYKRHFKQEHKNVLNETLSSPDGTNASTSTELEGLPKSKKQPAGNSSECHLDSIGIRCTRKRSAPDTFNETISKRLTIVDLSSEQGNVSEEFSNTSGCVESTAIDSVVSGEIENSFSIQHTNNIDSMKGVGKESTSDDVGRLVGNSNENAKTDEVSTEELEIDEISPSNDAEEIHSSSKKADKTLEGVSESMVEGTKTRTNDCTAIRILSMKIVGSSSNGKNVGTVVSSESVMTEDIVGNIDHSKFTSQQIESDMEMSNTNIGGMEELPKSDGVINQADELNAVATIGNLYENIKTEHKSGDKVSNAKPITSAVTALTKTPNEALYGLSEPMITEKTPTPLSNQLDADIFDCAKLITETISTGLLINKVDEIADAASKEFLGFEVSDQSESDTGMPNNNIDGIKRVGEDSTSDDVSSLVTGTEMFAANISSNVTKPVGKTSTFDSDNTIATTTENNEEEKLGPVPEWRKPGVKFGWARKSSNSIFYPGFLSLNEKFYWITTKAKPSNYSFKPFDFNEGINQNQKNKSQIGHLCKFNERNGTSFE